MAPFTNKNFLKECLSKHKIGIATMFSTVIFWAIYVSFGPYMVKILIDRSTISRDLAFLIVPAIGLLAVQFVMWSMVRIYDYFVSYKMIPLLRYQLAQKAITYIEGHSYNFFQNHLSGSISGRIDDLTRVLPDLIVMCIDRFFSHFLALIIALSLLWKIYPIFALSLGLWVITFSVVHFYFFSPRIMATCEKWNSLASENKGRLNDFFLNILSIKLFSSFSKENYLKESMINVKKEEENFKKSVLVSYIFYGYTFFLYQGISLYFLVKNFSNGTLTSGDFAFVIMINIQFAEYIWQLANDMLLFIQNLGVYKQSFLYLKTPHEIKDTENAEPLTILKGDIEFKDVSFQHRTSNFSFKHKSVTILPSQKVGIVGYSGAGKSTFVNLILRLFDVQEGSIHIDGIDIRNVTQESLRNSIGFISQDINLFHRTILENISYGKKNATMDEIINAAKLSHAHDFISDLPDGYHTIIGEKGIKLSGGQRQRLSIARVFLKNPPILILDEPTSQLDPIIEHRIQIALQELMKNKTTIIIAHRLSTLSSMDRILVFNEGKIIQDGNHTSLSKEAGLYQELLKKYVIDIAS